jgi:hypothetical protein
MLLINMDFEKKISSLERMEVCSVVRPATKKPNKMCITASEKKSTHSVRVVPRRCEAVRRVTKIVPPKRDMPAATRIKGEL